MAHGTRAGCDAAAIYGQNARECRNPGVKQDIWPFAAIFDTGISRGSERFWHHATQYDEGSSFTNLRNP